MTVPCQHPLDNGRDCPDPGQRVITHKASGVMVVMCGMHAMRYKDADGFTNEEIPT